MTQYLAPGASRYVFKTKPYKHQVKYLKRALRDKAHGCLWEPGTGKTKFIIDWASMGYVLGRINRVMVVCPLSVTGVWVEEFKKHSPVKHQCIIFDRYTKKFPKFKPGRLQVLIVNYDITWRRKKQLRRFKPDFAVADESHRIKKASANRTWYMRSLNKTKYRSILSGTPAPKSYLDLYSQWAFLSPSTFGTNIDDYKLRYIVFGGYMKKQVKGYKHREELRRKVRGDASIVLKRKALDLPEQMYQRIPVFLEPAAMKKYQQMAHEFYLELRRGEVSDAKNVGVKILRLQQIAGGFIKSDEGNIHRMSTAKLRVCKELLDDLIEEEQKVIVFARFLREIRDVELLCQKKKVPHYVLTGKVNRKRGAADKMRKDFQRKPGPRVFIAQIQTGGLGITLHTAHQVIFYSVTYALDDWIQACDRVHRIGQNHKVTYRSLVAVGTVDNDIYAALRRKGNIQASIMEDPSMLTKGFRGMYNSTKTKGVNAA